MSVLNYNDNHLLTIAANTKSYYAAQVTEHYYRPKQHFYCNSLHKLCVLH